MHRETHKLRCTNTLHRHLWPLEIALFSTAQCQNRTAVTHKQEGGIIMTGEGHFVIHQQMKYSWKLDH